MMYEERPWHATFVMFNAEGWTAHEWRFTWPPEPLTGVVWSCEHPGSMPLDELIDTLAYLHKMSPRMRRITWGDEYAAIHGGSAPQWGFDVAYDDYPPTAEGRLALLLMDSPKCGATWFFPDEVGAVACRHWQNTMSTLYWLCRCQWTRQALAVLQTEQERAG